MSVARMVNAVSLVPNNLFVIVAFTLPAASRWLDRD